MATIEDVRVTLGDEGDPRKLEGLLKAIGAIMVSEVHSNFDNQSFEGEPWAPRYPNQSEPFVSIAGLVAEFNSGRTSPRPQVVFERKPALLGSPPVLRNSIGFDVIGGQTVEVGADLSLAPHAPIHNFGLQSKQAVTQDTKQKLQAWLEGFGGSQKQQEKFREVKSLRARARATNDKTEKARLKAEAKKITDRLTLSQFGSAEEKDRIKGLRVQIRDAQQIMKRARLERKLRRITKQQKDQVIENQKANISNAKEDIQRAKKSGSRGRRDEIRKKVGFLFQIDELTTNVVKRQFIGVTKRLERDIADFVELWVEAGGKIRPPAKFGA